ncbi:hypothetical protein EYF80_015578 [Liparis tanakae]|uniref:Uncharacterized protein n=1 Tax=Liparis tanakae TaxID=230148 RepID=A0A4Z2IAG7_9TELE|nr:hypothetical protein EYF80_015578 [Liparis tanakae]
MAPSRGLVWLRAAVLQDTDTKQSGSERFSGAERQRQTYGRPKPASLASYQPLSGEGLRLASSQTQHPFRRSRSPND